jgi:trimeric autotransporter adhesin
MQKNSNRKGLALGAAFALVASLFVAAPAQAAAVDGANIGAYPAAGTTFTGVLVSDFNVYTQLKPGNPNTDFSSEDLVYKVEKTSGTNMDVAFSVSGVASDMSSADSASHETAASYSGLIYAGTLAGTASAIVGGGGAAYLNFKASSVSAVASWSPVTLKVTAWIDNQGGAKNDVVDSDEWRTTFTVTLIQPTSLTATTTMTQPADGDTVLTVSSVVSGANLSNIRGAFALALSTSGAASFSGGVTVLVANELASSAVALRGGVVSHSATVNAIAGADSFSASIRYDNDGTVGTIYQGYLVGNVKVNVASAATITALVATVAESDHATASGQAVAVRPNQSYTVRVHAATNSVSVSGVAVSVALSGQALTNGGKMISINGGAATSSYPTALALTTGADGYASFTLATSGFENGNVVNVDASVGNLDATQLVLTATTPAYSIVNDYDLYVTTPGTAVTLTYAVEDQWQVASSLTTQRLKVTRGGTGFSYATTVSTVAVAAGAASFAFTPSPATKTGSATVTATLERFDAALNAWVAGGTSDGTVTVNVTSVADAHSVAPAVSFSASVSYFPSTTSFETVTGSVKNAGASVVISGDASALVFRSAADKPTASGTVTVRADANGGYTFQVASLKSGEFDISINVNGSVTTSEMVVDPVAADAGKTITFDTTSIGAGSTKVITGTLVDMNGNPVNTSGSATILVTYTPSGNAGIPIGVMPTETDADGEFSFTVLTGPNDKGTAVVTAAYYKSGAATAVKDVLSFTQNVTVGAATTTTAPASDQKLTVGSFKGFVAIYALNYTGQKLSAKVAGKWLVVNELTRFQRVVRNTGAGYTIKVDLHIDGVFVRSETVVTK